MRAIPFYFESQATEKVSYPDILQNLDYKLVRDS